MKIAVVAPSRMLDAAVPAAVQALAPEGIEVVFHEQCFYSHGHFAGTDQQRADAFVEVANDPQYDAIWFARGGYGACRIVDDVLPRLNDAARGKVYLGFSDTGFLLAALYKNNIGKPTHGPMLRDIFYWKNSSVTNRLFDFWKGGHNGIESSCGALPCVAFNAHILASVAATPHMPKLEGHVVMLEEVSEHLYAIDRSLFSIMNAPRLKGAAGIRLGRVKDVPENDVPFGETPEEMVQRWCNKTGIPYLGRADIGHDAENKIVPFGIYKP